MKKYKKVGVLDYTITLFFIWVKLTNQPGIVETRLELLGGNLNNFFIITEYVIPVIGITGIRIHPTRYRHNGYQDTPDTL